MTKKTPEALDLGVPALFKYQQVNYIHLPILPGATWVLTADPWSYLYATLASRLPKTRGENRKRLTRAIYYAELAQAFYESAQAARLPARATLAYYGMLNLVKSYLSTAEVELESTWEHHGLTLPPKEAQRVTCLNQKDGVSIFAEFARCLGKPIQQQETFDLPTICSHMPEVHEVAFATDVLPGVKRKFLPVVIELKVNQTKTRLFSEVSFEKRQEWRMATDKFYKGRRKAYFAELGPDPDGKKLRFRSNTRKPIDTKSWPRAFKSLQREFSEFEFVSILARDSGYRYYCDLSPGPLHHLSWTLALFFYVGTIARYRPTEIQRLLESKFRPIVSEALVISPTQFLYQLVGRITKSACVTPFAKLS